MSTFLSTAEGRGKTLIRHGSPKTGARGTAGTWRVQAEAGAFWEDPAMGGRGAMLALRLQPMHDGRARGLPAEPMGDALTLWTGTEAEALLIAERWQSALKAAVLAQASLRLARMARDALPGEWAGGPAWQRLEGSEASLLSALRRLGVA